MKRGAPAHRSDCCQPRARLGGAAGQQEEQQEEEEEEEEEKRRELSHSACPCAEARIQVSAASVGTSDPHGSYPRAPSCVPTFPQAYAPLQNTTRLRRLND